MKQPSIDPRGVLQRSAETRRMQPLALAAVAVGGGIGSVLRYAISSWFVDRFGAAGFPWGTFAINLSGSFVIGIVLQFALQRSGQSPYVRLFFATGILGGYTTFSTYAYEIVRMGELALPISALAYALASVVFGVAAAYAGALIVRSFAT